jgi:hypothetical protein
LDSKGYTPEGNTVILDEHAAKSENEVNINEKTAEDNTKSGTQQEKHNIFTSNCIQMYWLFFMVPFAIDLSIVIKPMCKIK